MTTTMPMLPQLAVWLVLTEAAVLSAVAALAATARGPVPAALWRRTVVLGHLVFGGAAAVGVLAGPPLGLGPTALVGVAGAAGPQVAARWAGWTVAGFGVAGCVFALDIVVFKAARLELRAVRSPERPPLRTIGLVFYGAVAEEVLMRFGVLTGVAFAADALMRLAGHPARSAALAVGVAVSAMAFGAGHLPTLARRIRLNRALATRTILLNGLAGLVFSLAYVRGGLEAAMLAHGSADVAFLLILPWLRRRFARRLPSGSS